MPRECVVDVVVVGDGPAGCAAAITVAQNGFSVVLLGRGRNPGHGVPESLHPAAEGLCRRLGALSALSGARVGQRYAGVAVRSGDGETSAHAFGSDAESGAWLGWHVLRDRFDRGLRRRVADLKIRTLISDTGMRPIQEDGRVVGLAGPDGALAASLVIDATGPAQWARRHVGLQRRTLSPPLLAWRCLADGVVPDQSRPQFVMAPEAWWWIVALPGRTAACTAVVHRDDRSVPPMLPFGLRPRAAGAWADRSWHSLRPVAAPGLLLCGDAAGWLDPAAGDGVVLALQSGINAATTVCRILVHPEREALELALYDDWWCRRLEGKAAVLGELYQEQGFLARHPEIATAS